MQKYAGENLVKFEVLIDKLPMGAICLSTVKKFEDLSNGWDVTLKILADKEIIRKNIAKNNDNLFVFVLIPYKYNKKT